MTVPKHMLSILSPTEALGRGSGKVVQDHGWIRNSWWPACWLPLQNAWSSWVAAFPRQLGDSKIQFEVVHLRELAATEIDDVENKVEFITTYNSGNLSSSQ